LVRWPGSRRRAASGGSSPTIGELRRRHRFTTAIVTGILAFVAMGVSSTFGNVHAHNLSQKLVAFLGTLAFFIFAIVAVQSLASALARVIDVRASRDGGAAVRILVSILGFVLTAFVGLGLLSVSVQHLLIGGALTGVILGIAGQQALGNLFAGIVLLTARPFTIDENVRIRAGSLGGALEGTVRRIGLAYVRIETADGILNVPNSVMLSAGVGPAPPPDPTAPGHPAP
jgi:small-conductance mechanosensitive channel